MGGVAPGADFIGRGHCINPTCVQDRKQFAKTIANAPGMPVDSGIGGWCSGLLAFRGEAAEPVLAVRAIAIPITECNPFQDP
jgi:hypothetical protein